MPLNQINKLKVVRLGIETLTEFIIYMRKDCFVCKSEGFEVETRILVSFSGKSIIATLNVVQSNILKIDEASLSESAWNYLNIEEGDEIYLSHPPPVHSFKYMRAKIYGKELNQQNFDEIISDVVLGKYSNTHLASFITACARKNLNINEIIKLTRSMIKTGEQITWEYPVILDKHSVGGLPGNRTTPIVVAIVASLGLIIPKTSSRAITSPAGTADTIETMTPVNLSPIQMRQVIEKEGGCMIWGGALGISPADDIIIRVERSLDIDPEAQMIASVISKKVAVGATHVVIDIPVGLTAKIRLDETFEILKKYLIQVGQALGLYVEVIKSEGTQPLGKGIGPALEAKDILMVLRNEKNCPIDLKNKSLQLAGILLEIGKKADPGQGINVAQEILENGSAYKKFIAICEAQGGFREPLVAEFSYDFVLTHAGKVIGVDNRNLSLIAKLAGAPHDPAAGIEFFAKQGTYMEKGQPLYRIHAESKGALDYALNYAKSMPNIIKIARD